MIDILGWAVVGVMLAMYILVSVLVLTEQKSIKEQLIEMKERILGDK